MAPDNPNEIKQWCEPDRTLLNWSGCANCNHLSTRHNNTNHDDYLATHPSNSPPSKTISANRLHLTAANWHISSSIAHFPAFLSDVNNPRTRMTTHTNYPQPPASHSTPTYQQEHLAPAQTPAVSTSSKAGPTTETMAQDDSANYAPWV